MVADIQTGDMLNLPVPKANFHNVVVKPSEWQQEMVEGLAERADAIRKGDVDPTVDNILLVTNDGRKLALDQRLINPMLPDDPNGKISVCAENVFRIWAEHSTERLTQLVFSDLSTPKGDGKFNAYDDLKNKLKILHASHLSQRYALEDKILKEYPQEIKRLTERIARYKTDIQTVARNTPADKEVFPPMKIGGILYIEKAEAGKAVIEACKAMEELSPILHC